jgi:hypothetical protein
MPDLSDQTLPRIKTQRIPLDLGPEALHPAYEGLSLLNLPASLCRWLKVLPPPHPPLAVPELDQLAAGVRQVILVLIDAVSHQRFVQWLAGPLHRLASWVDHGLFLPLTSVVPSTTSAALTTLWTGRSPAEHGILGYELLLREYGLVANMITHSPAAFGKQEGLLYRAGFRPEDALPAPTLGRLLARGGARAYAFLAHYIRGSGLSRMHYDGVRTFSYRQASDLWPAVRQLAGSPLEQRRLIWIYYGNYDTLAHRFGPDGEQAVQETVAFLEGLWKEMIPGLGEESRKATLLLILSDHGQIKTPFDPNLDLRNHPDLQKHLHLMPTGENRLAYLYPCPGGVEAVETYFQEVWPGLFQLLPSDQAMQAGLFGPGQPHRDSPSRLGERVAIAQGRAYLWWSLKPNSLLGRHGGLSAQEMLIPLLALRLDQIS